MLLEKILNDVELPEWAHKNLWLVVHLINLLLCFMNEI